MLNLRVIAVICNIRYLLDEEIVLWRPRNLLREKLREKRRELSFFNKEAGAWISSSDDDIQDIAGFESKWGFWSLRTWERYHTLDLSWAQTSHRVSSYLSRFWILLSISSHDHERSHQRLKQHIRLESINSLVARQIMYYESYTSYSLRCS